MSDKCPDCGCKGTFKTSKAPGFKECEECGYWEDTKSVMDLDEDFFVTEDDSYKGWPD
jgi:hypothetical protein